MAKPRANRSHGFTAIELLVLIIIISLLILFVLPARQTTRETVRCSTRRALVSLIHQGEVFFAQSNNGWYSGFDRNGKLDTEHLFEGDPQSADWNGYDQSDPRSPAWRFRRLLENIYFTGEHCISPSEKKQEWQPGESVDPSKFSFAMLKIEGEADSPRKREHRCTNTVLAVVISDRAIRNGSGYRSVHTNPKNNAIDWKGSVCWNDNHATFEEKAVLDTQYDQVANKDDNLFTDSDPSGEPNAEAAMAWKSAGDTDAELME